MQPTGGDRCTTILQKKFRVKFAESEIKIGKSKEDFLKNTSIPGVPEWKGDGIKRPLQAAYEELTAK